MSSDNEIIPFFERSVLKVREDLQDSPYIEEALRVLPVRGYRSAIGQFWNAVVDDLRNKILFRGVHLFNQEMVLVREIKTYEDFQNHINDDLLIDGAYKTGVIGWEASKVLKHAKETRHIFSGHPKSSEPSALKVLALVEDCIKYVLNQEYPTQIIDINEYLEAMKSDGYDRNEVAIENALGDLPERYKNELTNRLFTVYIHPESPSDLIGNIEFMAPLLWRTLPKQVKVQVIRRIDQEYPKGVSAVTEKAFKFAAVVKATGYISSSARKYLLKPTIKQLSESLDNWSTEAKCVKALLPYAKVIPNDLIDDYVPAITLTYVEYMGSSMQFSRKNFYSNAATPHIPKLFQAFNDQFIDAFVETVHANQTLRERIDSPVKLRRLRNLGDICLELCSETYQEKGFLELLCDEGKEEKFRKQLRALTRR